MKVRINLAKLSSVEKAARATRQRLLGKVVQAKAEWDRITDEAYEQIERVLSEHIFDGKTYESLHKEEIVVDGHRLVRISAESEAILFLEFGTGLFALESPHPMASDFGMGAGTFSPGGHWDDPSGWWFPTSDERLMVYQSKDGQGWGHSYGNPPYMPFYNALIALEDKAKTFLAEVKHD